MNNLSRSEQALFDAVRRARRDPVWFRKHVLRMANDPWQDELLQAFVDIFRHQANEPTVVNHDGLNRFSYRSGHGPGKTTAVAQVMHLCGFIRKSQMICTATKFKQVTSRLWPTFRTILNNSIDEYRLLISTKQHKIIWADDNDWYATPETATKPENMQGYHPLGPECFLLFNVDEASGVKQEIFPVIEGTLTKPNTALLLIGNPTQNQGEFFESHNKPGVRKFYFNRHIRPEDSSHMDPKWFEQMRERYGENSPIFKVRALGEFSEDAANQLITSSWANAAIDREFKTDGSHPKKRVSVDVADGGVDECVFHAANMYDTKTHILKIKRRSYPASESPILAADEAVQLFAEIGADKETDEIVVDGIGVGAGTAGELMRRGFRVVVHKGGESSSDPKRWRNRRVQNYLCLRDDYRDGKITFSDTCFENEFDKNDMVAQLLWIRMKLDTERVEDLQTKAELIRESQKSPDIADSQSMLYSGKTPITGSIAIMTPPGGVIAAESEAANAVW